MLKNNKSGQVSIFIVIGVILVLVVTFLLVNSKFELFVSTETKLMNQVSDVVDTCIKDSTEQGLFLIGNQGGFVELSKIQLANPFSYTDVGFKIPSWEVEPNPVPTISSMENEINSHVRKKALLCIQRNLKALDDVFDFQYKDNLQIRSSINQNNVIVESNFPITFSEKNSEEIMTIESFFLKIEDLPLGDLYNLALEIYSSEQKYDILSNLVLDQIYSASEYTTKYSLPTEGFSFSCAKRVWTKTQLKENLINLNNNNFRYLQFNGTYPLSELRKETNFKPELGTGHFNEYYDNFYIFPLDDVKPSFENYQVETFVPATDVTQNGNYFQRNRFREFEVTPSDGELVQSTDMKVDVGAGKIPIPCVQLYHHLYTLDYDLIIKLTDLHKDGNKYTFQFPLRVEINNNAPASELPFVIPTPDSEKSLATSTKFCSEDSRQFPLKIFAIDQITGKAIDGVNISYKCLNLNCDVGVTEKPSFRGIERTYATPTLDEKFPFCIGGKVTGKKEGYYSTTKMINTDASLLTKSPAPYHDLEMIPTKTFKVDIGSVLAVYGNAGKRLRDEEDGSMFISVKNKQYKEFKTQAMWPSEEGIMDTLEFLDIEGMTYDVSVVLTDGDYQLRGIFDIKDWSPDIHAGNGISITIPGSTEPLQEDKFIEFYDASNAIVKLGDTYGIKFK